MKVNLLNEALAALKRTNHTTDDVMWVGFASGEFAITWAEFAEQAKDKNYDCQSDYNEVSPALVVVGQGWWLARHAENNEGRDEAAEFWICKRVPTLSSDYVKRVPLLTNDWEECAKHSDFADRYFKIK